MFAKYTFQFARVCNGWIKASQRKPKRIFEEQSNFSLIWKLFSRELQSFMLAETNCLVVMAMNSASNGAGNIVHAVQRIRIADHKVQSL